MNPSKLDPRLAMLAAGSQSELKVLSESGRFGLGDVSTKKDTVARVLVQCAAAEVERLKAAGMEVTSVAGDVAAGFVPLSRLGALEEIDSVSFIESSRPLVRELDLALTEVGADTVHTGPPGLRGAGVIVGIIDSGVDWRHGNFRNALGTSRILAIWDQGLAPVAGESAPAGFGYGVEYTQAQINGALAAPPTAVVRHRDGDTFNGHGTHVTGIAAGDGSAPDAGGTTFRFIGAAPDADIVVVANSVTTDALGDSANTLDALQYIFNLAGTLGRPVVVNMSQGDNLGPHDGTSLLERGIDNLLGGAGRAFVKSAGNEGATARHAAGTILPAGPEAVRLTIPPNDTTDETIDIWYEGVDRFSVTVTDPAGNVTPAVAAGANNGANLAGGNRVVIDSRVTNPINGANQIFIQLRRGTAASLRAGNWTITMTATTLVNGAFHAWIERSNVTPARFLAPHQNNDFTISIPGTALEVITVGSYVTRGAGVGSLSTFSSRGPTRDGRNAPTISAPGEVLESARANGIANGAGQYLGLAGTSMAAPMVAGTVALMLQAAPTLTQQQIIDCLRLNARADAFTAAGPATGWGAGKLDAAAAVRCRLKRPPRDIKVPVLDPKPIWDPKRPWLEPKPVLDPKVPRDPKLPRDPKFTDPKLRDPKVRDPKTFDPKVRDPKFRDPKVLDPKIRDPKIPDPKILDPKIRDPKSFDPKVIDPKIRDPKGMDPMPRPFAFMTPTEAVQETTGGGDGEQTLERLAELEAEFLWRWQQGDLSEAEIEIWQLVALAVAKSRGEA